MGLTFIVSIFSLWMRDMIRKATVLLGVFFMLLQAYEFYTCSFTIACSHYGSAFFVLTGFHGLHVIVGTIFMFVQYERMRCLHQT